MPRFVPFAGLRFRPSAVGEIDDVICPPYDMITRGEHQALLARSPYNVVRLEMPDDPDAPGDDTCYRAARDVLDSWLARGIIGRDPVPAFYGYRTTTAASGTVPSRETIGVVGAMGLEVHGEDGVFPHEHTTSDLRNDRMRLLEELRVNVSPVWALTPASGLAQLAGVPTNRQDPRRADDAEVDRATDGDGVRHEIWPITDPRRVEAISQLVAGRPVILADGHHRFETASLYRARRSAADIGSSSIMAYVVELSEEQLHVQAIHRLLTSVPKGSDVMELLSRRFTMTRTAGPDDSIEDRMRASGALAVISPTDTWLARPLVAGHGTAGSLEDLDATRLDSALGPGGAIEIAYQPGWAEVAEAVRIGRAKFGVLLRPPSIRQIAAIGQEGLRMPPKSTFFWPKPRTGLVLRELDA